jgi:hypothetical protein
MPVSINKPTAPNPGRSEYHLKRLRGDVEHLHCPPWVKQKARDALWTNALAMFPQLDDIGLTEQYRKMIEPILAQGPSTDAVDWTKWWRERPGRDTEQAPYMTVVQASRVSCGGAGAVLFDSEVRHRHLISLTIRSAYRDRHLSTDWIHQDKDLIEVYMTESQWAALISTLNHGSGTPATLRHIMHQPPAVQPELPEDRTRLFEGEVKETLLGLVQELAAITDEHKTTKRVEHAIKVVKDKLASNVNFVGNRMVEHMEERKARTKAEIEAHMNAAIARAGAEALFGGEPPLVLEDRTSGPENAPDDDPMAGVEITVVEGMNPDRWGPNGEDLFEWDETAERSAQMDLDRAHNPDPEEF